MRPVKPLSPMKPMALTGYPARRLSLGAPAAQTSLAFFLLRLCKIRVAMKDQFKFRKWQDPDEFPLLRVLRQSWLNRENFGT